MDFSRDYYKVLGLNDKAGQEQIRKAYRTLAHQYHPDKHEDKAMTERFHCIREAYELLSDEVKKRQYDAVRRQRMYSPYSFSKDLDLGKDERNYQAPPKPVKKKNQFLWLKPVILISIAICVVWILMHLKR